MAELAAGTGTRSACSVPSCGTGLLEPGRTSQACIVVSTRTGAGKELRGREEKPLARDHVARK